MPRVVLDLSADELGLVLTFMPDADAIARALTMPLEERRERHAAMLASVVKQDVRWWSARFIAALQPPQPSEDRPRLALAGGKG